MQLRQFGEQDEDQVIELWRTCGLLRQWNNPHRDIERKSRVNPELFLVGLINNEIIATAMGGYDGHRGWINYLAVKPEYQRKGYARQLMEALEKKLLKIGCPKINIQVRAENKSAMDFYKKVGYQSDNVISFGKRLTKDD